MSKMVSKEDTGEVRINSRRKGAKVERNVAKLLEAWTKRKFAKTPASGGLQWKSSNAKGDVVCTTEGHYFPFCIEVKAREKIDFSHLLTPGIKNIRILEFWEQCRRDATLAKKTPMLLMRYNGLPKQFFFMVLEMDFFTLLIKDNMFPILQHVRTDLRFWDKDKKTKLIIIRSTDFFKLRYKHVKPIAKQYGKNAS